MKPANQTPDVPRGHHHAINTKERVGQDFDYESTQAISSFVAPRVK